MENRKQAYFSKQEKALWLGSVLAIAGSFYLAEGGGTLTLAASLVGVTSLIFCAKGNPVGQLLMIVFSLFYGMISLSFRYYGEMLTYLGMTLPMAVFSLAAWMKNPYQGNAAEVEIRRLPRAEWLWMAALSALVTAAFYFILAYFQTANLLPSTISVTTSFAAVFLTFRRSPYYALGYAANDIVLIVLWAMATAKDPSYLSVTVCFITFLVNDLYGFFNWRRMEKRQAAEAARREVSQKSFFNRER
ncbi:nicotinamide riboside transporter PnuC [Acidaminobacterium chupaoyuni]